MIEMIAGVYGLRVESGKDADGNTKYRVKGMGPNNGPFSVDATEEARLVKLGLARYVEEKSVTDPEEDAAADADPIGFDETPPEDGEVDEAEVVEEIIDLETLTVKELRELGKEYGLTFKANDKKEAMIAAITEAQAQIAEDGEDAPAFDAAEAVL